MGLFSFIGKAVGNMIAPGIGGKIGGALGGALDGGKKKSSGSTQQQYIQPPNQTLSDLGTRSSARADKISKMGSTKVAATADTKASSYLLDDPWEETRKWWNDLGGEPERIAKVNKEDAPF